MSTEEYLSDWNLYSKVLLHRQSISQRFHGLKMMSNQCNVIFNLVEISFKQVKIVSLLICIVMEKQTRSGNNFPDNSYDLVNLRCIYTSENFPRNGKFFRGPHAQYDFFFRKNRTAHAVRGKFSEVYMHLNRMINQNIRKFKTDPIPQNVIFPLNPEESIFHLRKKVTQSEKRRLWQWHLHHLRTMQWLLYSFFSQVKNRLKLNIHFRKFSMEGKISVDRMRSTIFFSKKIVLHMRSAEKFSLPWKIFWSVYSALAQIKINWK